MLLKLFRKKKFNVPLVALEDVTTKHSVKFNLLNDKTKANEASNHVDQSKTQKQMPLVFLTMLESAYLVVFLHCFRIRTFSYIA